MRTVVVLHTVLLLDTAEDWTTQYSPDSLKKILQNRFNSLPQNWGPHINEESPAVQHEFCPFNYFLTAQVVLRYREKHSTAKLIQCRNHPNTDDYLHCTPLLRRPRNNHQNFPQSTKRWLNAATLRQAAPRRKTSFRQACDFLYCHAFRTKLHNRLSYAGIASSRFSHFHSILFRSQNMESKTVNPRGAQKFNPRGIEDSLSQEQSRKTRLLF